MLERKGLTEGSKLLKKNENWIRNRRARRGVKRRNNPLSQRQGGEDVEGGRKKTQMMKEKAGRGYSDRSEVQVLLGGRAVMYGNEEPIQVNQGCSLCEQRQAVLPALHFHQAGGKWTLLPSLYQLLVNN